MTKNCCNKIVNYFFKTAVFAEQFLGTTRVEKYQEINK